MNSWGKMVQGVLDLFGATLVRTPQSAPAPPMAASGARKPVLPSIPREVSARRKRGWSLVRRPQGWVCLVPLPLLHAPPDIQQALDVWIHAALHPSPGSRLRRKESQKAVFAWLEPQSVDNHPQARPIGVAWNLQELFDGLNQRYFDGRLTAVLRWSSKWGGLSTHQSLQTKHGHVHLITIAKAYDAPDVPRFAVEGVLFHEMCHITHPPRKGTGEKRVIHHKQFQEAERRFAQWMQWRDWERRHLRRRVQKGHLLTTGQK